MKELLKKIYKFFTSDIWEFSLSEATKKMYALIATIRVLSITVTAFNRNRILNQASSLSYTSLLALGPLIALIIIISSVFLKSQGNEFVYEQILRIIEFTLPALGDMSSVNEGSMSLNSQITEFLSNVSKSSATLGMFGTITAIITCILLCATMENAFNYLWNVKEHRKWVSRIVFYWALISLGSALGIFGMTFLASSQLSKVFSNVPYFEHFEGGSSFILGFMSLTLLLSFVYKFLPNAPVRFKSAFCGAIFATTALMLNNKLSFLYIGTVLSKQNFYGYLAVLPLALFSLYVFWLIVLLGAQFSFAVQNLDSLSSKHIWRKLSSRSRNLVCLAIFSNIARAFLKEENAPSIEDLSSKLKLAKALIVSCVNELVEKDLVSVVIEQDSSLDSYKPALSPSNISLAEFFKRLNTESDDDIITNDLSKIEKSIKTALNSYKEYESSKYASMPIKEIL